MTQIYRMRFEILDTNPGKIREFSIHMEAFNFSAAVESANLYDKKHLSAYAHHRVIGVDEIGELTKPDAP